MEIRENLELVEVIFENDRKKAVLTFLDNERGEVRTVNFNRQSYADGKYIDDEEKAKKVDEWCDEYFHTTFGSLSSAIGSKHTVYIYPSFNSLFEADIVSKFTSDDEGCIYDTTIKEVTVDNVAVRIRYEIDGNTYESKMTFAKYVEDMKKWFVDPIKKQKVFDKFEEKFQCPIANAENLVGHPIIVEVKRAFGTALYGDIKKFPKKK